ncbi:Reduced folate carrier [Musa troglodytarum]|uniref:Reduced folate carrier n=1 Tax=Musa troglodytarum TaxID=320322 RepID=A0A9E7L0H6_9LILI|nr:Reduced folate carrier [Musa troglodytarum]
MDPYGWLRSLVPQSNSIPRTLLVVLLLYSFTSQFLPIEPYLVPYLTSVKNFTNYQVATSIFPISVYAQLIFTLIMAPACYYLSHKLVITLGAFGLFLTYLIAWYGQSLVAMQIMQTSLTQTVSLLSFVLASELGQFLALKDAAYEIFFIISLTAGWNAKLKETWNGRSLKILSLWWAVAFAGISLVQNYGTNLFDAIDPQSKFNGHILAVSEAAGSLDDLKIVVMQELSGLSIFLQFIAFSGLFFVATAIFICFSYIDNGRDTSDMYMISEPEPEYILSDCVPQAG